MKYPNLVPRHLCKTPVHVLIESEEMNEGGTHDVVVDANLFCNYQDKAYTKMTADKQIVTLSGKAFFSGDIAPDLPIITSGSITVFGLNRGIYQGTKARNPDGTVNYTLLEVT